MLSKKNICYLSYSKSLQAPADRRRFVWFASNNNLIFSSTLNFNIDYDVLYVTYSSNLLQVLRYKKLFPNVKLIFELIDGHLVDSSVNSYKKGVGRFLSGKNSSFTFDIRKLILKVIEKSDAVVCSSELQEKFY